MNIQITSSARASLVRCVLFLGASLIIAVTASAQTRSPDYGIQSSPSVANALAAITVPGKANPWLADASSAAGGDTAPAESPVLVSLANFDPGDQLVFTATGGVSYGGGIPNTGPDGDLNGFRSLFHLNDSANGGPENNIGGLNAPANALVGVFLGPNPSSAAPSTFYNFSPVPDGNVPGSIDYTTLAPPIAKPFFIGDGVNASNIQQRVTVPAGATRLVLGSMDGTGWFNNSGSFTVTIALAGAVPTPTPTPIPSPTPPAHGGLSATTFTVNESTSPSPNVADTTLRFAARQTGTPAGLFVRVQYSTSSAANPPESSWNDLPNGNSGIMTYDPSSAMFVLSSLNYPLVNNVSFRAIAAASGYPDSISSKVGRFNLTSSKPRLPVPILSVTGNGPFADLYFRAGIETATSGISLRVQSSSTPFNELSWNDLNDGHAGHMTQSSDARRFFLLVNKPAAGNNLYYRAVAKLDSGHADGISKATGPFKVVSDIPPTVNTVTVSKAISGSGSQGDPILVAAGTFTLSATATAATGHTIKQLSLLYDGSTLARSTNSPVSQQYTTSIIGQHIVEALAVDELEGTSRNGTHPIHIRVIPSGSTSALKEENASGSTSAEASTGGNIFRLVKDNSLWSDATAWKDRQGRNGVPGPNDMAIIDSVNTVRISQATTVKSIFLDGNILNTAPNPPSPQVTLTVTGIMTIGKGGGDIRNVHLIIDSGATCEFLNTEEDCLLSGSVENNGKFNLHGSKGIFGLLAFVNNGSSNFQAPTTVPADAGANPKADNRLVVANNVELAGRVSSSLQTKLLADSISSLITNDGGSLITNDGGSLITNDGGSLITNDGGSLITNDGGSIVAQGGGNIVAQGGGNLQLPENAQAATVPSGIVQSGGETDLNGVSLSGPVTLNGGVLTGSGIIYGSLTNNGGYISPGHSAGKIAVTGAFTQGANGILVLEDGGAAANQFDRLQVGGTAKLGGTLDLKLIDGYKPGTADTFSPLGYTAHSATFASISSNASVTINATGLLTTVNSSKPAPDSGEARNISTRAKVQTGDKVVIGGFIVTGPVGSTKKVIVRGIGPSLGAFGIRGALADPFLELRKGTALLAANDNWKQRQADVQASGLAPKNDLESAIVATLVPGAYTVILHGAHSEAGVGLVEVYDLAPTSGASLGNISTRCEVQTGDNVMIGGFILQGGEPAKVLVRGMGPSLTAAGIHNALADPVLELHDANGAAITNDNWRETQEADIIATGIPPSNNKEAAILITLPPGSYTAVVRGNNEGTGVALVEVYNIK